MRVFYHGLGVYDWQGIYDWLGDPHRAHVCPLTGNVAPVLPEVAAALTGAFHHGLGDYNGFSVYDC